MELKEGLKEYRLELIFYEQEIEMFREVLKNTQSSHALWCEEEQEEYDGKKAVIFRIRCSTTSFALAFYVLGCRVQQNIISKRK